jgi:putative flippase GtrA
MPDEAIPHTTAGDARHAALIAAVRAPWPAAASAAPRRRDVRKVAAALLAVPVVQAFVRFIGVGCVGLSVDAGVFSLLDARHFAPEISRAASLLLATVVTWQLNRHITFGPSQRPSPIEAMRYALVAALAQGFSYGVFLALVYGMPGLPRLASLLIGAVLAAIAGFLGHKFFAFAPDRSHFKDRTS